MKKIALIVIALYTGIFTAKAQDLEDILLAADDASLLMENYLNPVGKGLIYSMNDGWFSTAKTHKKFGFDLSINANLSYVPSSDKEFTFKESDYNYIALSSGASQAEIPTVVSKDETETLLDVRIPTGDGNYKVSEFSMPGGIGNDLPAAAVPAPVVQLGFGLPTKTDIKLRFVPNINFDDDVESGLFGVGLQHNISQYFKLPENSKFNMSVLAAFSNMKVSYKLDDDLGDDVEVNNGKAEFKLNTFTIQAIGSLDFKLVEVYAALGYNSGKAALKMKGDYVLSYDIEDGSGNYVSTVTETISNPVDIEFEGNGIDATLGARLNLGFFKIYGDYTIQEYNTLTAGIAFSFR